MLRILEGHTNKAVSVMYTAKEEMKRGSFVTIDEQAKNVSKATGATIYMVDAAVNYNGINALYEPTDADFEDIAKDDRVIVVPVLEGETYATTEVTVGDAQVGDVMKVEAGKLVKDETSAGGWIYCGPYSDPTGLAMYAVKRAGSPTPGVGG